MNKKELKEVTKKNPQIVSIIALSKTIDSKKNTGYLSMMMELLPNLNAPELFKLKMAIIRQITEFENEAIDREMYGDENSDWKK